MEQQFIDNVCCVHCNATLVCYVRFPEVLYRGACEAKTGAGGADRASSARQRNCCEASNYRHLKKRISAIVLEMAELRGNCRSTREKAKEALI